MISILDLAKSHIRAGAKNQLDLVNALVENGVLKSKRLIQAFKRVDRALFMPPSQDYSEPYANAPQKLLGHATISTPYHHAFVSELLEPKAQFGSRVLDIGCGSGYLCAIFTDLVMNQDDLVSHSTNGSMKSKNNHTAFVLGLERADELVQIAKQSLAKCPVTFNKSPNQLVIRQRFDASGNEIVMNEEFDAIHVGYAMKKDDPELQRLLQKNLLPNGRLVSSIFVRDQQFIHCFDKDASGIIHSSAIGGPTACQVKEQGKYISQQQNAKDQLEAIEKRLNAWKDQFKATHGRAPNRDDMMKDSDASALFQDFARIRARKW